MQPKVSKESCLQCSQKSDQDRQPPDQNHGQQVCNECRPDCESLPNERKLHEKVRVHSKCQQALLQIHQKLAMDSISFFMPATSSSFGNSVSYQRKVFSELFVSTSSFHPGSPKQELRVHAGCQLLKFDSRKSKAFGSTVNVMESHFQSQLQQGVHAKDLDLWTRSSSGSCSCSAAGARRGRE